MTRLKLLSAVALLTVILPLSTSSSLAQGPGPCTRPGNSAVGPEGPAMNGGQLMAGVGQCERIGSWNPHYGTRTDPTGAAPSNPYYDEER